MSDNVNHPAHYGGEDNPYEAIKVIEAWGLGFHLGNAVKYIARAGKKGDMGEDLEKARWYIDRALMVAGGVRSEEEAERVPEDAGGVGTPVWTKETDCWVAHTGRPIPGNHVLFAREADWVRYQDDGDLPREDSGNLGILSANIRAATASWNAAHPDLPPVIVPEQFRESEEGPEVEAPEDAGDDGWIEWAGGECPVPTDTLVEVVMRNGSLHEDEADNFAWWHYDSDEDIVEYRVVPADEDEQPPTDPEARVGAMSNEEVEAELTGRGVERWWPFAGRMFRPRRGDLQAITVEGFCYPPTDGGAMQPFDDVRGDTTTPEGRAECSRRLLVHLLREEQKGD